MGIVPHDRKVATKPSQREAPLSVPMKHAIVALEKLKRKQDFRMMQFYADRNRQLIKSFGAFNPEKGITAAQKKTLQRWSAETAEGRNDIILDTVKKSIDIADKYLAAEMRLAWGTVDKQSLAVGA